MIGIDHEKANLIEREIFAFTASQADLAMKQAVRVEGVSGCVLISTCNRTELWINEKEGCTVDLVSLLCQLKKIPVENQLALKKLFVIRKGNEAFRHLFQTACGLKSQVWGEDQILTQVGKSIQWSREAGASDTALEKLFQMAVTSAKKIKTEIRLTNFDASVATCAMNKIKEFHPALEEIHCLVIGNGEMGKLIAEELAASGAKVTVTLRKYKCGVYVLPTGSQGVDYELRHQAVLAADVIISATASPHYTLKMEDLEELLLTDEKDRLFIDLAVPRDIDAELSAHPHVRLLDMDGLGLVRKEGSDDRPTVLAAQKIIEDYIEEYARWYKMKDFLPLINKIAKSTSSRMRYHLKPEFEGLKLSDEEKKALERKLSLVTEKVVSGLLYGIKDSIDKDLWEQCFENLEKSVNS